MFYVIITDKRFEKLYGCAVSDDGLYCSHPTALVKPIKFRDAESAISDARFRVAATRVNGEGNGHGIMHGVMSETAWIRNAVARRVAEVEQKQTLTSN